MKSIVAFALFVAVVTAAPQSPESLAHIVSQQSGIAADQSQYANSYVFY